MTEVEHGDSVSKIEDYEVMQQIGRGSFGAAFLVLHKSENNKYVLKKIRLSKETENFKNKECHEMSLIPKLRHPYIVEYKDVWVDKGNCICIVTNYCEVGNIFEILKARRAYFSEEKVCKWLTQLLLAIDYLHSNRILHGNLKLSNIFVTKENDIRLGDFGLAKILSEEGLASTVGSPNYMCPELLAEQPYCYKSDIWSLGCCMFEIAAHQQAFRAPDMAGLINKINRSLISPLPIVYSSTLKQIIKSMLRKSPEHRPTAAELLRHPHLQQFLLRCHNLSTVFLPVKSPSPNNNSSEKTKKPSPSSSGGNARNHRERDVEPKQKKELLPLFQEITKTEYPSLLDGEVSIEEELETKRVDPTSYSAKSSLNSNEDSPKPSILTNLKKHIKTTNGEKGPVKIKEGIISTGNERETRGKLVNTEASSMIGGEESKEIPGQLRADALESLLEVCARLFKQDKLDELSGVLKAFGDDAVSSRETAIWLTKSLMNNAQNLDKKS